jgi:integral membrane protein (TIGR01906 family)
LGFVGIGLWLLKRRFFPYLWQAAFLGGILTVGLVLAAGAGALADFNALFLQFHLVSFTNDLWQLDPARDRLIQMYPAQFFRDATMAIGGLTLVEGNLLWAVAAALRSRTGSRSRRYIPAPVPAAAAEPVQTAEAPGPSEQPRS